MSCTLYARRNYLLLILRFAPGCFFYYILNQMNKKIATLFLFKIRFLFKKDQSNIPKSRLLLKNHIVLYISQSETKNIHKYYIIKKVWPAVCFYYPVLIPLVYPKGYPTFYHNPKQIVQLNKYLRCSSFPHGNMLDNQQMLTV